MSTNKEEWLEFITKKLNIIPGNIFTCRYSKYVLSPSNGVIYILQPDRSKKPIDTETLMYMLNNTQLIHQSFEVELSPIEMDHLKAYASTFNTLKFLKYYPNVDTLEASDIVGSTIVIPSAFFPSLKELGEATYRVEYRQPAQTYVLVLKPREE